MERLNYIKPNKTTKESMIHHISSINKRLTKEYLETLTSRELLSECHPAYREDYAKELGIIYVPKKMYKNSAE
jgi:hypothetical protein